MLRSVEKLYGFTVAATDGDLGKLNDMFFDDVDWMVRYLQIESGTLLSNRKFILTPEAIDQLDWVDRILYLNTSLQRIASAPTFDPDRPLTREEEQELHEYYGWSAYWPGDSLAKGAGAGQSFTAPVAGHEGETAHMQSTTELEQRRAALRSTRSVIGFHIQATDGEIGHVSDFFVDERDWNIGYLLVDTRNWLPGRKVLIAPKWLERVGWDEQKVYVALTRDKVKDSPEYTPVGTVSRDYESELYSYYGFPGYWV